MNPIYHFSDDRAAPEQALAAFRNQADMWMNLPGASCALWWNHTPPHPDGPVGCIGAWQAQDRDQAAVLLEAAVATLRQHGISVVVGPMDGNTWRKHRLVVESDGRPPFFMEPTHAPAWVEDFESAGFQRMAEYSSAAVDLTRADPDLSGFTRKLEGRGIRLCPIDMTRFDATLHDIHRLSLEAFAGNFLYTPLTWENFRAMYDGMRDRIVPDLVRLAWDTDGLAAFLFGFPDLLDSSGKTVILKTLAARAGARHAGLGSVLTNMVHDAARQRGYTTAIHALQHESNSVHRLSDRFHARVFRRYALFARATQDSTRP